MTTKKEQARPPQTQFFGQEAFEKIDYTELRWLGNSGLLINHRGSLIMVDPVLEGFDMPLLIDMPITSPELPALDALLITHSDNDHFSRPFLKNTKGKIASYHAPHYVTDLMKEEFDIAGQGHAIGDSFTIGDIKVTVTPADHAWQNDTNKYDRVFQFEDFCGFWLETADGKLWIPGDSRFLADFMELDNPDAIFFDWSDNDWHIGFDNAVKIANRYPQADLILQHWGTVDAPDFNVFNGDPEDLYDVVVNPDRIQVLAAGQAFRLTKK